MKIRSYDELYNLDYQWEPAGDGPWELTSKGIDTALGGNRNAIGVYWIGFAKRGTQESFVPKYCGKAVKQSLYSRLNQHAKGSSNREIREALARGEKLSFRFAETPTTQMAEELEGLDVAAHRAEYWNERDEWTQHWAWMEEYPNGPRNFVEQLPEPEEPASDSLTAYPVRRGPDQPNPLREPLIEIYYGNGKGTGDAASATNPLFISNGVIFVNRPWLAVQRARMRRSPQHLPQVFRGKVARLAFGRILDLRIGRVRQQWLAFLQSRPEPEGPSYGEILEQPDQDIWQIFTAFLNSTGRNIDNYDTIIRPEFLRRGVQYCVRDPKRANAIFEKLEEVPEPFQIKVLGEGGLVHEVLVDPAEPQNLRETLRYIAQRNRAESGSNLRTPRTNRNAPLRPFSYTRPQRFGAAAIGILVLAEEAAEMYALYSSLPPRLEVNLNLTVNKSAFWASFGVPTVVLAVATSDKVPLPDGNKAKVGALIHPTALSPNVLSEATDTDLRFFLAFVDNVDTPYADVSVLDATLSDLVQYMRFLAWGRASGSILPAQSDADLPLSRIRNWYAVTERPKMPGSTEIIKEFHSIDDILARIRSRLISQEEAAIPTREYLFGANTSRTRHSGLAVDERVLRFKDMADSNIFSPLPDLLSPSQNDTRCVGLPSHWGNLEPRFHQVGPVDVGKPFWWSDALLVTGADAETNAFLSGALAENEIYALVQGERTEISAGDAEPDLVWIEAPLVYVEANCMTLA